MRKNIGSNPYDLRQKAENLLAKKSSHSNSRVTDTDALKLIHELEVHQIELELQNEELFHARSVALNATEKYVELYDFAPSGYVTLSESRKILKLNHAAARMLGKERSILLTKDFAIFINESTRISFNEFLRKIFDKKGKETCEIEIRTNDFSTSYLHIEGIASEDGMECHATIVDYTAQKRALEQAEKSNRQKNLILEAVGEGIVGVDLLGNLTFANPMAGEILGCTSEDLFGKNFHILFHHHHRDGSAFLVEDCPVRNTIHTGKSHIGEDIFKRRDESSFPVEYSCLPIKESNKITGAVVTFRDITQHKQLEEALRSEERFRAVTQSANDAIITTDNRGKIIGWNRGAEKIFGYLEDEILNKDLSLIIPEQYVEHHIKGIERIEKGKEYHGIGKTIELVGIQKTGEEFPAELSLAKWETEAGRFFTGIFRDITQRKKEEQELIKAKEKAEESDRLKSAFLANMSHEIRTPMNAILGFSGMLKKSNLTEEQQKKYIGLIEKGTTRLLDMINDIVDISKIESGQMEVFITEMDVSEQLNSLFYFFSQEIEKKE